jgi:hypothetical protein
LDGTFLTAQFFGRILTGAMYSRLSARRIALSSKIFGEHDSSGPGASVPSCRTDSVKITIR